LIENWLQLLGILLPVLAALLAAFWKLLDKIDKNKSKYQQDVLAIRGTVIAGDVIPRLIGLIEKVETERTLDQSKTVEQILEKATYGHSMQQIVNRINELNDMDILYTRTIFLSFACAYDVLSAAVLTGICTLWLFIDQYWEYFISMVILAGLIILIKLVYDILQYTRNLNRFIQKDNEMRLGRNIQ
jgi:hypothetical protein